MKYAELHRKIKRIVITALKASNYEPDKAIITPVHGEWSSNPTEEQHMFNNATNVLNSLQRKHKQKPMNQDEIDRFVDGEIAYSHYFLAKGLMNIEPGRYTAEAREAIEIMKQVGHSEAEYLERLLEQKLGRK